jgi:hypothetical protein
MASDQSNGFPPLILVGMHRSGTSLAAALLRSAGVNVGNRLMEGNWSNPHGHFEDLDFVEFHRAALARLGCHHDGWVAAGLPELPPEIVEDARAILERKGKDGQPWGWKDPRTTLFLRLWLELLPRAKLVLIYRAPWEVIDSLYRRGDEVFAQNPEFAVATWHRYNRTLLDASDAMPERCLLASVETIAAYPSQWVGKVRELTDAPLADPDPNVYDGTALHGAAARVGPLFHYYPEVVEIFSTLENRSWHPPDATRTPAGARRPTLELERRLALRDWQDSCTTAAECARLRSDLCGVTDRLQQLESVLADKENATDEGDATAHETQNNGACSALPARSSENRIERPDAATKVEPVADEAPSIEE